MDIMVHILLFNGGITDTFSISIAFIPKALSVVMIVVIQNILCDSAFEYVIIRKGLSNVTSFYNHDIHHENPNLISNSIWDFFYSVFHSYSHLKIWLNTLIFSWIPFGSSTKFCDVLKHAKRSFTLYVLFSLAELACMANCMLTIYVSAPSSNSTNACSILQVIRRAFFALFFQLFQNESLFTIWCSSQDCSLSLNHNSFLNYLLISD